MRFVAPLARLVALALCAVSLGPLASPATAAEKKSHILVLDFELSDTSGEPADQKADHARRLALMRDEIARGLEASQLYVVEPREKIAPELDRILAATYLRSCNGCEFTLAEKAGADLVMLGEVNKISTLILSMRIVAKDVRTRAVVFSQGFDFRGDTDAGWLRAAKFFTERMDQRRIGLGEAAR